MLPFISDSGQVSTKKWAEVRRSREFFKLTDITAFFRGLELEQFRELQPKSPLQIQIYELHDGGLERLANEMHPRLPGGLSPFLDITRSAAGNHVPPVVAASLNLGNDVVYGQVSRGMLSAAVLARKAVSDENILSGEGDLAAVYLTDELDESNDSRDPKASGHRPDDSTRFLDNFDLAGQEQGHGPLPRDQADKLVPGIEDNHRLIGRHLRYASRVGILRTCPVGPVFPLTSPRNLCQVETRAPRKHSLTSGDSH